MRRGAESGGRRPRRSLAGPRLWPCVAAAALVLPPPPRRTPCSRAPLPPRAPSVPTSPRRIVLTFSEDPDVEALAGQGARRRRRGGAGRLRAAAGARRQALAAGASGHPARGRHVHGQLARRLRGRRPRGPGAFAFGVGAGRPARRWSSSWCTRRRGPRPSPRSGAGCSTRRWCCSSAPRPRASSSTAARCRAAACRCCAPPLVGGVVALALLTWGEKMLVGAKTPAAAVPDARGQVPARPGASPSPSASSPSVLVDLWPARWSLWVLGATGAAAVLVHVAAGHAASPSSVWLLNIFVQWVHMTAVGVWVGGLFWLLLGFRGRDHDERAAAVGVFTRIATWTLVVVLATGLVRAVVRGRARSALSSTPPTASRSSSRWRSSPGSSASAPSTTSSGCRRCAATASSAASAGSASTRAASSPSPWRCWRRRRS